MSDSTPSTSVARLAGKGGRYHHGRLRGALIVAAAQILEQEGDAGLTMRGLAERAGVSRTAPYRHFNDKKALLAAVAEQGFLALDGELANALTSSNDSAGRLQAMGRAYLAFSRRYVQVFRLMFADPPLDTGVRERGIEAIRLRFNAATEGDESSAVSLAAFALVHGVAQVSNDDANAQDALNVVLTGLPV